MKTKIKIAAFALTAVSLASVFFIPAVSAEANNPLYGDANTDGKITIGDATYIQKHEDLYIERTEDGVRVKMAVLQCPRKSVQGEARTVYNNVPELFVTE